MLGRGEGTCNYKKREDNLENMEEHIGSPGAEVGEIVLELLLAQRHYIF